MPVGMAWKGIWAWDERWSGRVGGDPVEVSCDLKLRANQLTFSWLVEDIVERKGYPTEMKRMERQRISDEYSWIAVKPRI